MNQEKETPEDIDPSSPPKEETSNNPASTTEPAAPGPKAKPVIFYIVLMFSVALFLIILSFFMQQRNHEVLLKGLSSSSLQVQNLVDLELNNNKLEEALTNTLTELETAKAETKRQEEAAASATRQTQAMEYLMEAQLSYSSGKHSRARELLAEMQKHKLEEALPEASSLPEHTSPRAHYQNLVDALK